MLSDRTGEVEGKGKKSDGKIKFDSKYCTGVPHDMHQFTLFMNRTPPVYPQFKEFLRANPLQFSHPLCKKKEARFCVKIRPL